MANLVFDFLHHYQTGERRASDPADAYQYDEGHVMEAVVPVEVTSCEIHYWVRGMDEAEAYVPTSITPNQDGSYTILGNIPNSYFETYGDLRVYIVVTDGTASITTYEGRIHICERSKPDDYVDDDPDNEAVQIIAAARGYAETSEAWAVGQINGEDVPSTADQYQNNASYYADQAASAASSAAAQASLAPAYDNTATYEVGDYCLYSGQLYECTTAITTAEAWDSTHWTAVTVGGELATVKDGLNTVKDDLTNITNMTVIHWTDGGYIYGGVSVGGTLDLAPRSSQNYAYAIVDASVGDVFLINGTGASNAYLWVFVDSNNAVLSKADVNLTGTNLYITAPSGSAKLVLSTTIAGKGFTAKGETIAKRLANIDVINGTERRMIAGVIRNTGSGWEFIVNERHQGDMNCVSVDVADDGRLYVDYSGIGATKVISAIFAPDEAFASLGYVMGASVGLTASYVQIYQYAFKSISANLAFDSSGNVTVSGTDSESVSASWDSANSRLVITHPDIPSRGATPCVSLMPWMYGRYITRFYSNSGTSLTLDYWDANTDSKVTSPSSKMNLSFTRFSDTLSLNEVDPSTVASDSGNIWFIGIFEV